MIGKLITLVVVNYNNIQFNRVQSFGIDSILRSFLDADVVLLKRGWGEI